MTNPTRPYLTIVTGLPRSGTSMMMRMLEAGGLKVLVDDIREADDDNPRGYYEFEPVKRIKDDASWVAESMGKAVKMVYSLMYKMPPEYSYRVLFMRRAMPEVLASQQKMLARHSADDDIDDAAMSALFERQLADFENWLAQQTNIQSMEVNYNHMVANSAGVVSQIVDFLDGGLDRQAMTAVVDPALYRNRGTA